MEPLHGRYMAVTWPSQGLTMEPMSILFAVMYCMGIISTFQMFMPGVGQRQGQPPAWDKLKDALTHGGILTAEAFTSGGKSRVAASGRGVTPWPFRRNTAETPGGASNDTGAQDNRVVSFGGPPSGVFNDKTSLLTKGSNGEMVLTNPLSAVIEASSGENTPTSLPPVDPSVRSSARCVASETDVTDVTDVTVTPACAPPAGVLHPLQTLQTLQ